MRYLRLFPQPLVLMVVFVVTLGSRASASRIWTPIIAGTAVGVVLGLWALGPIRRNLVEGEASWTTRPVPGGIWFFVGLGVLVSIVGIKISSKSEELAIDLGLGLCVMLFVIFSVIGVWVRREERRQKMEVWVGPNGFEFRAPE